MADKKRLIDANALVKIAEKRSGVVNIKHIDDCPTVDAVEAKQYKALLEWYNDLREDFIDYVCSGIPDVAQYCVNRSKECTDCRGWCKKDSDKCRGFNPAKVIVDGGNDNG